MTFVGRPVYCTLSLLRKIPCDFQELIVNDDVIWQQFKKLEERVGQLGKTCSNLKKGKAALEAKIEDLEQTLKKKDATEQRLMEERSVIRSRIDHLLSKLDQVGG